MTSKNRAWLAFGVILLILIFDQVLKYWIKTSFYPNEARNLFGNWFRFLYVENQGMAFGATFGSGIYAKLFLSIFRLVAVVFGIYYLIQVIRDKEKRIGYVIAISLVLAGATGNLLDSAFYDFIFPFDPNLAYNWLQDGEGFQFVDGEPVVRKHGFLLGNVVDMFQFNVQYPSWMPFGLAGEYIFSAIWNVADASIFCGIVIILIRQKAFFPSKKKVVPIENESHDLNPEFQAKNEEINTNLEQNGSE
jgi:signal peptidase II